MVHSIQPESQGPEDPVGAENVNQTVIRAFDQDFRLHDSVDEDGAWQSPSTTLPSSAFFSWSVSLAVSNRT